MIEVVFSDSACGSLKVAQHFGEGKYRGGAVGVILNKEKPSKKEVKAAMREAEARHQMEWEDAVPLGGDPADVFSMGLGWSMGDISDDGIGESRRSVMREQYSVWPKDDSVGKLIEEKLAESRASLERILRRTSEGESVRLWYSHSPEEMCGFCWLMTQLCCSSPEGRIYTVKLPEWEYTQGGARTYTGWGDISPGQWGKYVGFQQEARPALLKACAGHWTRLQRENAPLRIYLNGRLRSAPEDIYDSFILRELDSRNGEFSEAEAIGDILGRYQLGIGDGWIAMRIEKFIDNGLYEALTAPDPDRPIYGKRIRKRT